ncbi:uncharacterized protein G2W53_039788 [Senna tora]|uniref:Uncharacterized protein n=1 Tax=Senna tora TaxID=362788 RepID=A0A834SQ40_9FABA|nr:uncharacterized protein G2W53_039788 [Senna tora]
MLKLELLEFFSDSIANFNSKWVGDDKHAFYAITSPILALNALEFRYTTQSDCIDSLVQQHV